MTAWQREFEALAAGAAVAQGLSAFIEEGYASAQAPEAVIARYRRITERYRTRFGDTDILLARAPGRINLIGEHTDYNGPPVLPMAVNRDIAAVFAPRKDSTVVLTNTDPVFPERSFQVEGIIPLYPTGDWGNYAKVAVQGLVGHLGQLSRRSRENEPYLWIDERLYSKKPWSFRRELERIAA